jgi:ArsR family transcriptional regulator
VVTASALPTSDLPRVELFKVLGDAARLKLLALCAEEELSVGELADVTGDSQPQVSRRASPLRQLGLLQARKEGTRTFLRARDDESLDPVVGAALSEGRRLANDDGSLARVPEVIAAREESAHSFFETSDDDESGASIDEDDNPFLSHLAALAPLLPGRRVAVDVGCGEGVLLDVLAPLFERVFAVDRSQAQLARAAQRVRRRGFHHVRLFQGGFDDVDLLEQVDSAGGADLVFASRVLHHAPRPAAAVASFARLLKRGGHLVVLDYLPHHEERMREEQADVWLGFSAEELSRHVRDAGLDVVGASRLPDAYHRAGPDAHLPWQAIVARHPEMNSTSTL